MNYYCQWCDKVLSEQEVEHRKEDRRYNAPYGDNMSANGGGIDKVPVCPECYEDLEEVVE